VLLLQIILQLQSLITTVASMLYFIICISDKCSKVQDIIAPLNTKSCTLEHEHLQMKYDLNTTI
jgi:hypothetical protein